MIEITLKNNIIKAHTIWAMSELLNEEIVDLSEVLTISNDLNKCLNHWFNITDSGEFMLSQLKFENKVERL